MKTFEGKKVLITGGTTGIGMATAKLFLSEGGKVAVTGQSPTSIESAKKELTGALVLRSDTSKVEEIEALAAQIKKDWGSLDVLFVNAGIAKFAPLDQVTPAFFDETMSVNLRGAFFTVQKLVPLMPAGSAIVLNTSVVDEKGMATTTVYSASKAGLRSLARTLAGELVEKKIRVNAVSPGPIETPIYGKMGLSKEQQAGFQGHMASTNPMKRFGRAEEVAKAVLFVASEGASYTTGAEIPVDGGLGCL